ncbi:hypothetical protein RIF29_39043 [Crotalaria pallida]|uniref:Uncharacterized protein n=1 Tax=Crotalaria pallida TaxID=3830 RepID=A0AAN9E0Y4_CROPI
MAETNRLIEIGQGNGSLVKFAGLVQRETATSIGAILNERKGNESTFRSLRTKTQTRSPLSLTHSLPSLTNNHMHAQIQNP